LLANAVGKRRKCRQKKPVRQQAGSYKLNMPDLDSVDLLEVSF
jgi:hypothetical protein